MGKKVKCKDCSKRMEWAMPQRITAANYEAAKLEKMIKEHEATVDRVEIKEEIS